MAVARTLYDKLWDSHLVSSEDGGLGLLYIDRHLINEVTSPQAYEGLRLAGRMPRRPDSIIATADHNIPTDGKNEISDKLASAQVAALTTNIHQMGAKAWFPYGSEQQGIVHVIGPELGATLPGMTVVCGDSHTSTHGAFAALGIGIGTSDVEHVLATQTLEMKKAKNMLVTVTGSLQPGTFAKDVALEVVYQLSASGAAGHVIEFDGDYISNTSMEERMTICNMAIEAGARSG